MSNVELLTLFYPPPKKLIPHSQENMMKASIISFRNSSWNKNPFIPHWVNINSMGLDQFFTRPDIATRCYDSLLQYIKERNIDSSKYIFVEPSAGLGAVE